MVDRLSQASISSLSQSLSQPLSHSLAFISPAALPNRQTQLEQAPTTQLLNRMKSTHSAAFNPLLSGAALGRVNLKSASTAQRFGFVSPQSPAPFSRLNVACLASRKGLPEGGYHFDKEAGPLVHLAAKEAKGGPMGPEHLFIVLLERLDLSVLKKMGITANAVRVALGLPQKRDPGPISLSERVSFHMDGFDGLEFSEEMDQLFDRFYHEGGEEPISKDVLVHGILQHVNHDPNYRMQALVSSILDKRLNLDDAVKKLMNQDEPLSDEDLDDLLGGALDSSSESDHSNRAANSKSLVKVPGSNSAPHTLAKPNDSDEVKAWREAQKNGPKTPVIDKLGTDLTALAADDKLSYAFGREYETIMLSLALQFYKKGSAIVVGPPGSGKTALVEGLAKKIVEGEVASLKGYRLVSISVGSMMSGTQYRGMLEKNIQDIIKEAQYQNIIVFIDEIHGVIGSGRSSENTVDIGNLIKAAKGVKWVGATTNSEYTQIFKKDEALDRRFERITLSPPDRETLRTILQGVKPKLMEHYGIEYSDAAVEAVINYCDRYVPGNSPDKEITALDRAGAWARHEGHDRVDAAQVALAIEKNSGIPLTQMAKETASNPSAKAVIDKITGQLREHVIGQHKAVDAVANAIFQSRIGVNADRPFVLVFAGPTGTGKSELAKAIGKVDGRQVIEINLEAVKQVSTLKGAEPGYVGHGQEGVLTGPQKLKPYSVVLFDEMEKTTDEVIRALLGLMDNGKMTDSTGEEVSFKNAIIVFTTNHGANHNLNKGTFGFDLGLQDQQASTSPDAESIKKSLGEKLGFEVVGRFSDIVVFDALQPKELIQISRLILGKVAKDVETSKNINIDFGDILVEEIAIQGHDPQSGARAIRRICDDLVRGAIGHALVKWPELNNFEREDKLAVELVALGQLKITYNDEALIINVAKDLKGLEH